MKKQFFLIGWAVLLGSAAVQAQFQATTVSSPNVQGVNLPGTNNIFIRPLPLGTGTFNTVMGMSAATANTTGSSNTFIGQQSAAANTTGSNNTFIGRLAGITNTTGTFNTTLGINADVGATGLQNATAIGANARVNISNALVLGSTGNSPVNVGIGTSSPAAHLHLEKFGTDQVLVHSTSPADFSNAALRTGTGTNINEMGLTQHSTGTPGNVLAATGPAPAIPWANLSMLYSTKTSILIGTPSSSNIHMVTGILRTPVSREAWECLRINAPDGFVGIHTRTATSAGTTGNPQALFHVNLTNPAQSTLNPVTNGIRFEGLPSVAHPLVVVADNTGNLATFPISSLPGGTPAWLLGGNTVATSYPTYIGTNDNFDFNLHTNGLLRGRITADGNWDFGSNSPGPGAVTTAAFGMANSISSTLNAFAGGSTNNIINNSDNSAVFGFQNILDAAPASFAAGKDNNITASTGRGAVALGNRNKISSSNESVAAGEDNTMRNGHGTFMAGGHNISDGAYNITLGSGLTTNASFAHTYGSQVDNTLNSSIVMGFSSNRTLVLTNRGVAIQVQPTAPGTYVPMHNLEVEAAPPASGGAASNIALLNLPVAPTDYPSVVIDPATGELFRTPAPCYINRPIPIVSGGTTTLEQLLQTTETQAAKIVALQAQVDKLLALAGQPVSITTADLPEGNTTNLEQNVPNPFHKTTTIRYHLAAGVKKASISFSTMDGKMVQIIPVANRGRCSLDVQAASLAPGIYIYTLIADGRLLASKRMEVSR